MYTYLYVYSTSTKSTHDSCFFFKFLRLGPSAAGKSTLLPQLQVVFRIQKKRWPYGQMSSFKSEHMTFIYIYDVEIDIDSSGVDFS